MRVLAFSTASLAHSHASLNFFRSVPGRVEVEGRRSLSAFRLAFIVYFLVSGGPFGTPTHSNPRGSSNLIRNLKQILSQHDHLYTGIEPAVYAGGTVYTLIALVLVPISCSLPQGTHLTLSLTLTLTHPQQRCCLRSWG